MKRLNEQYIRFSVHDLAQQEAILRVVQRKLNPQNFDATDNHISIEEKYAIRDALSVTLVNIDLLKQEMDDPTGEDQPKRRFFRK